MKSTGTQKIGVRKISLQLNSHIQPRSSSLAQGRLSLSYSTNLKKRTDALYAQKAGLDRYLLKSEMLDQRPSTQGKPVQHYQKRIRQYKPITASKAVRTIKTPQLAKTLQTIQINAKSLIMKDKESIMLSQKETQRKSDLTPNYGTITTLYIGNSSTLRDHKDDNLLHTCPDFDQLQNYHGSENLKNGKDEGKLSEKRVLSNNSQTNPQIPHGTAVEMKNDNIKVNQTKKRVLTNPSVLNDSHKHSQNKQMYRTNNINLSEHFKNYEEKGSVFPTCRKMTISNVNRLYELCIEQIRNSDLQKKSQRQQQKAMKVNDERIEKQIKQKVDCMKNNTSQKAYKKYQRIESANITGKRQRNEKSQKKGEGKKKWEQKNTIASEISLRNSYSFTNGNRNYRNQVQESKVWLEIKNSVGEDDQLGYSLCTKKQLVERVSLTQAQRRNILSKNLKKNKCTTQVNRFEDEQGNGFVQITNPLTAVKINKLRTVKLQKSAQKNMPRVEDNSLAAWDTSFNNMDNIEASHQAYHFD